MKSVRKAVFPVAGLGTRFLPATKSVPKEMLPLLDKPLIQYAVDEARAAGIEEFIFVTSDEKPALEHYFDAATRLEDTLVTAGKLAALDALASTRLPEGSVKFVQQNKPRGLGDAVLQARDAVGDAPFAVILPDDIIRARNGALSQMVAAYDATSGHVIATEAVAQDKLSSYGVVDIRVTQNRLQSLQGLVEKPARGQAPSDYGIVGRYILKPSIFECLARQKPGSGGEVQLTDAIAADLEQSGVTGYAFDGQRFDCGSVAGFLAATIAFAQDRPELADIFNASTQYPPRAA